MTVDTRFYASLGALTLESAAALTGSTLEGDPATPIVGVGTAERAKAGELAFLDAGASPHLRVSSDLSVLVVSEAARSQVPPGAAILVSKVPRLAHSLVARHLFRPRHYLTFGPGAISESACVHTRAVIGPGVVIGPDAAIGEDTVVAPNAVIGPGVQIGRGCFIGIGASVLCALVGDHVTLASGVRIGEAGFGVTPGPHGLEDAPHWGRVIVQDHVSLGANTCVDRGVFDDTIIGERTKIDNLCQIAHNVVLGRSVIMAAFAGISGSVRVGDGALFGGRVGIADHTTVGAGVSLAAASGVLKDVPDGETWGGSPAKPLRQWMREVAWLAKQAKFKKSD